MTQKCIRALVSGRVQGVFFRDSTREQARRLGLHGYAINLPDGRVEVLACGEEGALQALSGWLRQGPPSARVTTLEIEEVAPSDVSGFRIG